MLTRSCSSSGEAMGSRLYVGKGTASPHYAQLTLRPQIGLFDGPGVTTGGLPGGIQERDLEDAFIKYGTLRSVWVARRPPGFGEACWAPLMAWPPGCPATDAGAPLRKDLLCSPSRHDCLPVISRSLVLLPGSCTSRTFSTVHDLLFKVLRSCFTHELASENHLLLQ